VFEGFDAKPVPIFRHESKKWQPPPTEIDNFGAMLVNEIRAHWANDPETLPTGLDTVVLDLGGVLYHIYMERTYAAFAELLLQSGQPLERLKAELPPDLVPRYETGRIDTPQFLAELRQAAGLQATDAQMTAAWNALLGGMMDGRDAVLEKLAARYRLGLLSNINPLHYDALADELAPYLRHFNGVYMSHHIGRRKPEVSTFAFVCKALGADPARTLFVDDTLEHLFGAQQAGLAAWHCTGEAEFSRLVGHLLAS
jgi:putative hydrolase of the HAD superfamily